jgi:hypothetical protein
MAELVPSLTHLQPPGGFVQLRLDRFSPNLEHAAQWGFTNVRPARPYPHVYPFEPEQLARLVWHFDFDYADGRDPGAYTSDLRAEIETWRAHFESARLELRDDGDQIEIIDTRPIAARSTIALTGPERLAYLALDAGATSRSVAEQIQAHGNPSQADVEGWLDEWQEARLVMREGDRYLALATNLAERIWLPAERIAAFMQNAGPVGDAVRTRLTDVVRLEP